jgi:CheY-like chemotaxis protein
MTSPYDRAVKPSTTMAAALILLRGDGGSGWRRSDTKFRPGLRELIAIKGVTSTPARNGTGQHGEKMVSEAKAAVGRRVLVVEDESMIRMLLDGMLSDIGYTMTAEAGALDEAMTLAKQEEFDVAILDVNLHSEPITPVAEILTQRGLPFVFATGADLRGVPQAYRSHPTLQKPFRVEALERALQAVAPKPASA